MGLRQPDENEAVVELALRDASLHRALLEQLDGGACIVNRDRRILYWNGGAERISGYLSHEVAGQYSHGDLLMHCENDGSLRPESVHCSPVLAPIAATAPQENTVFLLHKEGHRLLVQLQSRPIQNCAGEIVGAVELFEEVAAPLHHRARELEAFGCSDFVTRAANRRFGEMMLRHAIEALNTFEIPFGWLRVDLDRAHELEHTYGHGMVDASVRMIAATIDRSLTSLDVLTRWDTAEFRVEISRCSRSELATAAERLLMLVRASSVDWWGDRLSVTVSVGGATAEPGDTTASLEERVATVLEDCRASGGNRAAIAHLNRSRVD
jgi:diguanylate cyclase (GGDEF)-like protein/PAS domain S-box-containing protein